MFSYTAFEGFSIISQGRIEKVAIDVKRRIKENRAARILVFSDSSGKQMDLDLSGSEKDVLDRLAIFKSKNFESPQAGPGRPKLGVVPREISLLPEHWEWLSNQPGGSSATIRLLVAEKIQSEVPEKIRIKKNQECLFKFLNAIAGDLPNFEDAIRYLYRRDRAKFKDMIASWPKDLVNYTMNLAEEIFSKEMKRGIK